MIPRLEKDHIETKNMYFQLTYVGNLYKNFLLFRRTNAYLIAKVSPKWITRSKISLRRWQKDYIEGKNMQFHLTYLGDLY